MIINECHYSTVVDLQSRKSLAGKSEAVIVKLHDNWSEFYFDEKKDIDEFITDLIKLRDLTFQ